MAYCSKCQHYITVRELLTKPMVCPSCEMKIAFSRKEYRDRVRPGMFVAILLCFNVYYTTDPVYRMGFNGVLMLLWFFTFYRFIKYLKEAKLEMRE